MEEGLNSKKKNNILLGVASLTAGVLLMLFLREKQVEIITDRFEDRAAAMTKRAEESRKVAIQQMETRKVEAALKKTEAEQKKLDTELALLKAKKENSPECRFWKLQKKQGTSTKADEKITEHCTL